MCEIDWSCFGKTPKYISDFMDFISLGFMKIWGPDERHDDYQLSNTELFPPKCFSPVNWNIETNVINPVFDITPSSSFILSVLCACAVWAARGPSRRGPRAPCTCLALALRTSPGRVQEILGALHVLQSCCYFWLQKRRRMGRGCIFYPVIVTFNAGRRGRRRGWGSNKAKAP